MPPSPADTDTVPPTRTGASTGAGLSTASTATWLTPASPLRSLVRRAPVVVEPDATVAEVADLMRAGHVAAVLVRPTSSDGSLGIVTSADLRDRVLADRADPATPVAEVMTCPVHTLPAEAPAYAALALMLDEGYGQIPVTDDGTPIGLVSQQDLLRLRAEEPLLLLGRLHSLHRLESLDGYAEQVATTARTLFDEGVDAVRIARVIAGMNDALTGCLLRLAEDDLGPAPTPYAWLALGSEGRMEQVLLSDQDNALAYAEDTPAAGSYFPELARLVVDGLERAGFARCPGGYMAITWVHPLDRWAEIVRTWLRNPEPEALVEAAVFLDFRAPHGTLAVDSLDRILLGGGQSPPFLAALARAATRFPPQLGHFGRIRAPNGVVDLKRSALTAIVILARLFALEAGSTARTTVDRLAAAAHQQVISRRAAETLTEGFRFLTHVRLREQLRRAAAGEKVDNTIRLEDLSWLEHRRLVEAFRSLADVLATTRVRLHAD